MKQNEGLVLNAVKHIDSTGVQAFYKVLGCGKVWLHVILYDNVFYYNKSLNPRCK